MSFIVVRLNLFASQNASQNSNSEKNSCVLLLDRGSAFQMCRGVRLQKEVLELITHRATAVYDLTYVPNNENMAFLESLSHLIAIIPIRTCY